MFAEPKSKYKALPLSNWPIFLHNSIGLFLEAHDVFKCLRLTTYKYLQMQRKTRNFHSFIFLDNDLANQLSTISVYNLQIYKS